MKCLELISTSSNICSRQQRYQKGNCYEYNRGYYITTLIIFGIQVEIDYINIYIKTKVNDKRKERTNWNYVKLNW